MKKFVLLPLLLACSACATIPVPPPPVEITDQTTLDERVGIITTDAYTAASTLGYRLAQLGVIDKEAFKAADQVGYDAVQLIHTAYLAGNATNYNEAINRANLAIAQIKGLVK